MIKKPTLIDLGVAVGCGLLMAATLPIVIPFLSRSEILGGGWLEPLALFGLIPFLHRLREASPRRAFGLGVLAGAGYFLLSLYWLDVAMTTFGHMPRYLSFPERARGRRLLFDSFRLVAVFEFAGKDHFLTLLPLGST